MQRAVPLDDEPIPFITLPNWVKAAARCGFNIEPVFEELGITTDLLNLETATIERPKLERAMERCVSLARHAHFPFVLGDTFDFDYLPDLETFLSTSPNLRAALRVFDWVRELVNPFLDLRLREHSDAASIVLHFSVTESPPKPWFSETTFATLVKFGRRLLGEDAPMLGLRFRHQAPEHAAAYPAFFRLPVQFSATEYALDIDRTVLDMPLAGAYESLHVQARERIERRL
ncbi:MAG: AraC family transcriptional regulator ligand-binding domain-containing protein, partial [Algiphilus sp.]